MYLRHLIGVIIIYFFQLSLPDSVTERQYHSLSAIQLSPHCVLLVIFGGWKSPDSARLSPTARHLPAGLHGREELLCLQYTCTMHSA